MPADPADSTTGGPAPGFLRSFGETRAFSLGRPSRIHLTPDGHAVLFLRSPPRDPTLRLYETTVATGHTRELVSPAALLGGSEETISEEEKARRERMRVTERGFTSFVLSSDGRRVLLPLAGRVFLLERDTLVALELPVPPGAPLIDPRLSPDGRQVAFVRGQDIWLVGTEPGAAPARQLTGGGSPDLLHGLAEFVAQEEMHRFEGYWWSPDARQIAYTEVDQSAVERFAIADPAHPERPPVFFRYPRPGRANARVRLGLIPVGDEPTETRWVAWDEARYPYLARVCWDNRRAPLTLLVQTRDQREAALLAVDASTGETSRLLIEKDDAWVNLDRDTPRWLPDGSGFLWATDRHGRRALELRRRDGAVEREVIPGAAGYLSLSHVAPRGDAVIALIGDAISNRIERFPLDGGTPILLTADSEPTEHAPVFARDGSVFVDTWTTARSWPEVTLARADGAPMGALPSEAEEPPFRPNLELTVVGEQRRFHAAVIRPRDFDSRRRYPVVVQVYGGPHAQVVKSDARAYLLHQWIADHGAVVVCLDNRGTPRRDRAWERAIKGSFAHVALEDQVAGLQALGRRHPELDLQRVGIYGWSFGGAMAALAVLRRPDVFKVAVAGAPVVDWRDYDTHYTERYLDLPERNPAGYEESSLLTHAPNLTRPLLLVHGTADDNVYFFHSLKLADALFRAGRPFELLPLAGVTHQIADAQVRESLWKRIAGFLLSHL